jgi:hypothetical protein
MIMGHVRSSVAVDISPLGELTENYFSLHI